MTNKGVTSPPWKPDPSVTAVNSSFEGEGEQPRRRHRRPGRRREGERQAVVVAVPTRQGEADDGDPAEQGSQRWPETVAAEQPLEAVDQLGEHRRR